MNNKQKIFIVTQIDPIYMISFFEEFFDIIKLKKLDIDLEIFDMPNFNESKIKLSKRLLLFYGLKDFLKLLIIYLNEILLKNRLRNFQKILSKEAIKYQKIQSINDNKFYEYLTKYRPHYMVSISAPEILKDRILSISEIQYINLHCAPLPSYKGMMPNFWQKLNNETYSAITIHEISNKIDGGKILYQKEINLLQTDSLHKTIINSKKISAIALLEYLFKKQMNSRTLNEDSYFSFPKRKDVNMFRKLNKRFF